MKSSLYPTLAGVLACVIWGLSVFFYKLLEEINAAEILAHRAFWSMVFFSLILGFQKKTSMIFRNIFDSRRLKIYVIATLLISINWFGFIYSIQVDKVTQASFGYFIFPIVAVALGFLVNKETFSNFQTLAIGLALFAIIMLGVGLGELPYISMLLALSFGFYGLIKGHISQNPIVSVGTETMLIAPFALAYIFYCRIPHANVEFLAGYSFFDISLLVVSGVITALPLVLFAMAAQSLRYSTVGLINYINPTLQFLIAVFILQEEFGYLHFSAFLIIWVALIFYSYETFRLESSKRVVAS